MVGKSIGVAVYFGRLSILYTCIGLPPTIEAQEDEEILQYKKKSMVTISRGCVKLGVGV